jgi:phosphoglycerate dehydrogenase-like enzyme
MRIVIVGSFDTQEQDRFQAVAGSAHIHFYDDIDEVRGELSEVDGLIGSIPGELIASAPRLRWIHSPAAGVNSDLSPELLESDIVLTSSAGNGGIPLAEHAMMLMLMLNRSALRWLDAQRKCVWDRFQHGELNGKTVGIVGLGNAGTDLALKAKAFHMRVVGMRRRSHISVPNVDQLYTRDNFEGFLAQSDFVVVAAPLTTETKGMFDATAFAAMRASSYFICISRGGIADDAALLVALRENQIAGAGLDAHGTEPLPADSEFWTLPQVIVTPHNGATTAETAMRGREITLENISRFVRSEPLLNVVDKAAGY